MGIGMHYFDTEMAIDFGDRPAILMNHILYWCYLNEVNGKNFSDGRFWTTNSNESLRKIFPYWSKSMLETVISKCKINGLLLVRIDNDKPTDRTRSFAPTELAKSYVKNSEMHFSKIGNGNPKNRKCLYKEENNKKDNTKARLPYADQMGAAAAELIAEFLGSDDALREAFDDYVQMRKKKKSPIKTIGTAKRTIARLKSLSGENRERMIRILDQSIRKGWTDLYPLDEDRYQRGGLATQTSAAEVVEQEDYSYGDE